MTTPLLPLSDVATAQILLQHYSSSQQSIAARAALAIYNLWMRIINPAHFSDSWRTMSPLINGIIATHYEATAADAALYYANSRVISGFRHVPVPGQEADMHHIRSVTDAMGPGRFFGYLADNSEQDASDMTRDGLRGASTRMIMKGGRDTIVRAANGDPVAHGWERIIEPGACSFCAMLAGRGGVYTEETVGFRAHDHCHCVARPVFEGQESVNKNLSSAWGEATRGTRGKAMLTAWDKYWSEHGGREGTQEIAGEGSGPPAIAEESVRRAALPH